MIPRDPSDYNDAYESDREDDYYDDEYPEVESDPDDYLNDRDYDWED